MMSCHGSTAAIATGEHASLCLGLLLGAEALLIELDGVDILFASLSAAPAKCGHPEGAGSTRHTAGRYDMGTAARIKI